MPSLPETIEPNTKRAFLTFIKELDRVKKNGVTYRMALVKCDCGNIKEIPLHRFRNESVYSCGCRMYQKMTKNPFYKLMEKRDEVHKRELEEVRRQMMARDLSNLTKLEADAINGKISPDVLLFETKKFLCYESIRR